MNKTAAVSIERTYPAPASELWALWTTKEGFESWWGPQGFRAEVHAIEAKPDGVLHYSMIAATKEMIEEMLKMGGSSSHEVKSRFSQFEPERALALTSVIDFLPGVEAYESLIEVKFEPRGDKTHMTVLLYAMHDAQFTAMQQEGFTSQLTKLDQRYGWASA